MSRIVLALELYPRLYRLALRLCGNHEDAQDAVQETYLRCLPALERLDGDSAVAPFLYRALRNLAIDQQRYARRHPHEPLPIVLPAAPADDDAERRLTIAAALTALPPAQARVVTAVGLDGWSQRDYAAATRVPLGTIKTQWRLGVARLRRAGLEGEAA